MAQNTENLPAFRAAMKTLREEYQQVLVSRSQAPRRRTIHRQLALIVPMYRHMLALKQMMATSGGLRKTHAALRLQSYERAAGKLQRALEDAVRYPALTGGIEAYLPDILDLAVLDGTEVMTIRALHQKIAKSTQPARSLTAKPKGEDIRVYLAGPDVFRPNANEIAEISKALCARRGYVGLSPVDSPVSSSDAIFQGNVALIKASSVVIANLNPFRGAEVDTGTAFEIGMAFALGKKIIGFLDEKEDMAARVARCFGPVRKSEDGLRDENDDLVENFGNPVNLMISSCCEIVQGGLEAALALLPDASQTTTLKGKRNAPRI